MDPRLTSYADANSREIRIFSDYNLQRQIDRAIAVKNPTKPVVVVAHADNERGVGKASLTLLVKIGDEWSVSAAAYKEASKPLSYGAEVVWEPDL